MEVLDSDGTSMEVDANLSQPSQGSLEVDARLARDVLAIPISTVASESAFSTSGRILDDFRTSLTPFMLEALVCGQDWLRRELIEEFGGLHIAKGKAVASTSKSGPQSTTNSCAGTSS